MVTGACEFETLSQKQTKTQEGEERRGRQELRKGGTRRIKENKFCGTEEIPFSVEPFLLSSLVTHIPARATSYIHHLC